MTGTRKWTPNQILHAQLRLLGQLSLWEAQRNLEIALGDEEGTLDMDETISHFCAGLDKPAFVGAPEAIRLLDQFAPQLAELGQLG